MSAARSLAFIACIALSPSCGGGGSAKQAGEACVSSSECVPGLLCDRGTNTCAKNSTATDAGEDIDAPDDDAPEGIDAADIDAPAIDAPPIDAPDIDAPPIDAPDVDAPEIDAPDTM